MMRAFLFLAPCFALLFATPGNACRVARSPEQKLQDGYRSGAISGVALVTITSAVYSREAIADAHPWTAEAKVDRIGRGVYGATSVRFDRGWGSAACDEGYGLPSPGDRWVIYFWKQPNGEQRVWASYPLAIASASDPTIFFPQDRR